MNNQAHPLVGVSIPSGVAALEDFVALKLGTLVLFDLPESAAESRAVMRRCRELKLHVLLKELLRRGRLELRGHRAFAAADWTEIFAVAGESLYGRYVAGEGDGVCYWPKHYTLRSRTTHHNLPPCSGGAAAHRKFVSYLKSFLDYERRNFPPAPLITIASSLLCDYFGEAGADGFSLEMPVGNPDLMIPAVRGAARAYGKPWGAHIAIGWYGGIRLDELWQKRWRLLLGYAYLSGAENLLSESGHYEYNLPGVPNYGFHSPETRRARRTLREFYRLTAIHSRPANGPTVPLGVVLGVDEGYPAVWTSYVWGQYERGERWLAGGSEEGWKLIAELFRSDPAFQETTSGERDLTGGLPDGTFDLVPAERGDFSRYRTLIFAGTNRMTRKLYAKLVDFVNGGGTLIISLCHFNVSRRRSEAVRLWNGGDLRRLCGIKVRGAGKPDVLGVKYISAGCGRYAFPVRGTTRDPLFSGVIAPAELEITSSCVTVCAGFSDLFVDTAEHIRRRPLLLEHRLGAGAVYLNASFTPPGDRGLRDFSLQLWRCVAAGERGEVTVYGSDRLRYSRWDGGTYRMFYLLNTGFDTTINVKIRRGGMESPELAIAPAGLRSAAEFDGLFIVPIKPAFAIRTAADDRYEFFLPEADELQLVNLSAASRRGEVNGIGFELAPGQFVRCFCAAHRPESDPEGVYSPEFPDEPEIEFHGGELSY